MDKQKKMLLILSLLAITSTGGMVRITSGSNIRLVDYLIILATGAMIGLLIRQIFSIRKNN
jgi:hypothetical protein